jgi:hypothetical protein
MPDRDVKTIRDLIFYHYAKIIARRAFFRLGREGRQGRVLRFPQVSLKTKKPAGFDPAGFFMCAMKKKGVASHVSSPFRWISGIGWLPMLTLPCFRNS